MITDGQNIKSSDESIDIYLKRARRALAGRPVSSIIEDTRAIIGVSRMPLTLLGRLAGEALAALKKTATPTPIQLSALETIIRLMRPVPLSQKGELEDIDQETLPVFGHWLDFKKNIRPYLYSIGRLDLLPDEGVGTGFLISETLVMTNRHVLDYLSYGSMVLEKGQAAINFGLELGDFENESLKFGITRVRAIHPVLDMCLLEIEPQTFDAYRQPLLIGDDEPVEQGLQVAAVGYPFADSSRNPLFAKALFNNKYGVKRAALGEILQTTRNTVFHDCSTLGGNSGSPVLSLKSTKVVGLHCGGQFLYRNEAVSAASLKTFVRENN